MCDIKRYSSLQSSDTLNFRRMITHKLASLYTVQLSAVNGLSRCRLTKATKHTTSKGAGTADSNSNRISKLRRSIVSRYQLRL